MRLFGKYPWEYVSALPFDVAVDLLIEAKKEDRDERLFQRWIYGYQHVDFDEFKASMIRKPVKSEEEVLEELKEDYEAFGSGYRTVNWETL